jgi:hypothetical protein
MRPGAYAGLPAFMLRGRIETEKERLAPFKKEVFCGLLKCLKLTQFTTKPVKMRFNGRF